ncbi:MAG: GNAT family N-acetyltransferase [Planctomycetes bacterium]|nr:GNAT family N-acetyltransferase [Planctomycetota bacterium]
MKRTVGWNEARHQQEPKHPECYQMVCRERQRVGFLSLRDEPQFVYLPTIQLVPDARASGIGTLLMQHVEHVAVEREYDRVRLRVFKGNPAKSLYDRLGYVVVESDDFSYVMEKKLRS